MRSTPTCPRLSEVTTKADFESVPMNAFQGRSSSASTFHASLLQAIDGVMSLLTLQVPLSGTLLQRKDVANQCLKFGSCFVPAGGSVSSSSTLQIFRDASH